MYSSCKYSRYSDRCGVIHCYTKYGGLVVLYVCGAGYVDIYSHDLILTGNEFHKVGAAIEKALVPMFVLILGIENKCEVDDRSCLALLAEVSSECKYAGCPNESA